MTAKKEVEMPEVEITQLPECRVQLLIKASKDAVQTAYKKALKNVSKGISLPGFRKGKAPQEVLEKKFPKEIDKEWRHEVLYSAVNTAVESIEQKPLKGEVDKVSIKEISKEDGAQIEVEYETEPAAPDVDLSSFTLKKVEDKKIEDADVQKTIERLRHYHAEWKKIDDRPVEDKDWVSLEIVQLGDSEMTLCDNRKYQMVKGEIAGWMYDLLLGAKIGEPVEGKSKKDDEVEANLSPTIGDSGKFKPQKYRITVKEIATPQLPEMDEETVKKFGVDSLEKLTERVRQNLEKEAKDFVQSEKRDQLETWLLGQYPLELPPTLTNHEEKILLENRLVGYLQQGISESWIKEHTEEIKAEIQAFSKKRLTLIYLLRKVAIKEDIHVMMEELNKELIYEQAVRPPHERLTTEKMQDKEKQSRLYLTLLTEKCLDHLIKQVEK